MFTINLFWDPTPRMLTHALNRYAGSLRSWRVPFERSVREVMGPSFQRNFDVGGRPPWAPLEAKTAFIRGASGPILVRSGDLRDAAGRMNLWTIDGPGGLAFVDMSDMSPEYGAMHQTGTRNMIDRPWAVIQEEDADQVQRVFEEFLVERGEDAGFSVRRI